MKYNSLLPKVWKAKKQEAKEPQKQEAVIVYVVIERQNYEGERMLFVTINKEEALAALKKFKEAWNEVFIETWDASTATLVG